MPTPTPDGAPDPHPHPGRPLVVAAVSAILLAVGGLFLVAAAVLIPDALQEDPPGTFMKGFDRIMVLGALALGAPALAAGIGLWKGFPWGRYLGILYFTVIAAIEVNVVVGHVRDLLNPPLGHVAPGPGLLLTFGAIILAALACAGLLLLPQARAWTETG